MVHKTVCFGDPSTVLIEHGLRILNVTAAFDVPAL